jgi:lipid-binding SYLF domain-containing protein
MKFKVSFISLLLAASVAAAGVQAATTAQSTRQYGAVEAQGFVDKSVQVIDKMQSNPRTAALLRRARGVLIVPNYLKAALIVGGQGGVGVLMGRHAGRWSGPAFFTISGLSVGFQAGGDAGAVAYVLMTDRAVRDLENRKSTFRLGADAGLTVAKFSGLATTGPTPDVIVWTATEGLFGGVAFDGTDVATNYRLDQVYYQQPVSVSAILDNSVHNPRAKPLQLALSAPVAQPR